MNNKGLSELITTVLIIGFTIVLAAVVMTWGSGFVKNLTVKQASSSDLQLECNKIDFKINEVKVGNIMVNGETVNSLYGSISNNLNTKIDDFIIQLVKKDGSTIPVKPAGETYLSLDPYQTLSESIPISFLSSAPEINDKIRIIPRLKIGKDIQSCPISYAKEKVITG